MENNNINATVTVKTEGAVSPKFKGTAAVLCFFLGGLGVHRFYTGKIGTAILWLCTLGLAGVGMIVDFIMILCGSFKDSDGLPLK